MEATARQARQRAGIAGLGIDDPFLFEGRISAFLILAPPRCISYFSI